MLRRGPWLVLAQFVVETFSDALAHQEVSNAGFRSVWLVVRREVRTRHGRHIITQSLFPGYNFVEFNPYHQHWKTIPKLRGVKSILGPTPEKPQPLPKGALEELRARFAAGEMTSAPKPNRITSPLVEGAAVLIDMPGLSDEPLPGICKMSSKECIKVMMSFFGAEREITVSLDRVSLPPTYQRKSA